MKRMPGTTSTLTYHTGTEEGMVTKDKGQHEVLESVRLIPDSLRSLVGAQAKVVWLKRCSCGGYWFQLAKSQSPRHLSR